MNNHWKVFKLKNLILIMEGLTVNVIIKKLLQL